MWADHLPRQFDNTVEAEERSLMYVGITRPEDFLAISASGYSTFICEIENSKKVDERIKLVMLTFFILVRKLSVRYIDSIRLWALSSYTVNSLILKLDINVNVKVELIIITQ
jgi:hypothetical protein